MSPEVLCYGEALVDFSQYGTGPLGFPAYEALPGGAPANVAAALAKWGCRAAFSGRVGTDALGTLVRKTLLDQGVDVAGLVPVSRPTAMAIVSLDAHGDRSFDILWSGTACDGLPEVVPGPGNPPAVFHFGSVSMCDPEGYRNTLGSARGHRSAGCLVSFDPNLRPRLWSSPDGARYAIREGLGCADLVKISEEEVAFALGEPLGDRTTQARVLWERYQPTLLFVTLGPEGCLWVNRTTWGTVPAPKVRVADTTGAGDCFMAGVLQRLLKGGKALKDLTREDIVGLGTFGVAAGSLSTTRRGGIPGIPDLAEVENLAKRT